MTDNQRYEHGYEQLIAVSGESAENLVKAMGDIDSDLTRFLVEFAYGDIYGRNGIDLKSRQIGAIGALTALGTAGPQLKLHVRSALNVGCSQQEIVEVMLQTAIFAGFPAATNGLRLAREVFAENAGDHTDRQ